MLGSLEGLFSETHRAHQFQIFEIWNTIPYFIAFISIIIAKLISVLMVLPLFSFIDSSDGSFRIRIGMLISSL
jgi:ABC-type microcin C transport system permease subunit YejE